MGKTNLKYLVHFSIVFSTKSFMCMKSHQLKNRTFIAIGPFRNEAELVSSTYPPILVYG